jgi:hypothetical protein
MTTKTALTTLQVAERFDELARQEKWFEIQDELFAANVKSIEPPGSPYFKYAEGKEAVKRKGKEWVKKIEKAYSRFTSQPLITGNHFAVGRVVDITVIGFGRIQIDELMVYEVRDGEIISEQFFY